jgi:DNA polymerase III delta prime subunit
MADTSVVKEWHTNKNLGEGKKVCIISALFVNHEAQQSLLKILEEPQTESHFFLIIPNANLLLDTIRSRAHVVKLSSSGSVKEASVFIKSSIKERLESIALLIEQEKDKEGSGSLRHNATALLSEIEKVLHSSFKQNMHDGHVQFVFSELQKGRDYLSTPGASVKMILEHIALIL